MKPLSLRILILFFLISSNSLVSAQYQDFGSWWNFELSNDLGKDLSAGMKLSQRFDENSLRYDRSLATFTLDYELLKNLDIEGGYRFILVKDRSVGLETRYRLHGSASYEYKISTISFSIRDQLQYGFDDLNLIEEFYTNKFINRTKFSAKYSIFGSFLTVHSSYELFLDLNSIFGVLPVAYRFKTGAKYTLSGRSDLDLSYMLENEFNVVNPVMSHIIQISFAYKL